MKDHFNDDNIDLSGFINHLISSNMENENTSFVKPSQAQVDCLLEHYRNRRFSQAEQLAISITGEIPGHSFAWKVLGAVLGQTGRKSDALNAHRKAILASPNDAGAHYNLANMLQGLSKLEDAVTSYKRATKLKPDYAEAYGNLGITFKAQNRLEDGLASYMKAIVLNPDYADAYSG